MTNHDLHTHDEGPRANRPKRRTFTHAYKLRILQEYDAAPAGEKGALLRREGLYDSSIQLWRKQRDGGEMNTPPARATPRKKTPEQVELEQLRREKAQLERDNARMSKKLTQTEAAMEILGKAHALLEIVSESADSENS